MLARRIEGVLRRYPDPLVAYMTKELLLGFEESLWRYTSGQYELNEPAQTRDKVCQAIRAIHKAQEVACDEWIARSVRAWIRVQQVITDRYDSLVAWVARLVNRWLRAPTVHARQLEVEGLVMLAARANDIADWANATHPNIMSMSVEQAAERADDWHEEMRREATGKAVSMGDVVYRFPDGWTLQRLTTRDLLRAEGDAQGICVGQDSYVHAVENGRMGIYSLRDAKNVPHVTVETQLGRLPGSPTLTLQVKGRGNAPISKPALCKKLSEAFEHLSIFPQGSDWQDCYRLLQPENTDGVERAGNPRARRENPTFRPLPYFPLPPDRSIPVRYGFHHDGELFVVEFERTRSPVPVPVNVVRGHDWFVLDAYTASFYRERDKDTERQYALLQRGGAVPILGTVIEILRAFARERQPEAFGFTADRYEPSRVRLYNHLMSRIKVPGYVPSVATYGEAEQFFLVREDVP